MPSLSRSMQHPGIVCHILVAWTFCFLAFASPSHGQMTLSPEQVYRKVSPTVVMIRGRQGTGSGIVVDRDGTILTNRHVVNRNQTVSITASVLTGGRTATKTFDNIKVWKIHPKYDLALLRVTDPSVMFYRISILPESQPIATGAVCFALGNPGGAGEPPAQSITQGVVSSAKREVLSLDYLQISAALNPGNSGGPVVDTKGRALGVATWKLQTAEGIGFAIPFRSFKMSEFIPVPDSGLAIDNSGFETPRGTADSDPIPEPPPNSVRTVINAAVIDSFLKMARQRASDGLEIPVTGLTKPLPSRPDKVILGYGGTCLIMRFPELRKLGVFDMCQARFVKYIELPDPLSLFAAGGNVLLIYDVNRNQLAQWNMETWTKEGIRNLEPEEQFTELSMGLLNSTFALVVRANAKRDQSKLGILSVKDGTFTTPNTVQAEGAREGLPLVHFYGHLSDRTSVKVEDTGGYAVVCGGGRGFMNLKNPVTIPTIYNHMGGSYDTSVVLGGSHLIAKRRDVFRIGEEEGLLQAVDQRSEVHRRRISVSDVAGFRGFAEVVAQEDNSHKLQLRALPQMDVIYSLPIDKELASCIERSDNFPPIASAYIGCAAIINQSAKTVTLLPLEKRMDATDQAAALPGRTFSRKIRVPDGTSVTLESGPPGLSYDAEAKTLKWDIPKSQQHPSELNVILLLTDSKGYETYLVEKIVIP